MPRADCCDASERSSAMNAATARTQPRGRNRRQRRGLRAGPPMRAASPSTGFYRTSPRPPGAGERPRSGGWETEDADFVDGQEPEPEPEPESPKEVSSPTKVTSPKGAATSNLYDEEEIEQPPVPMLPCLLRTPKMHEDRDNHARFLRNEAANFRAELKYDDKRRQSEQLWSLITSKEKDRRLVMMRLRKLLGEGADVDELSETKMSLIPPPASADAADQEEEDDDEEEEEEQEQTSAAGFTVAYTAASRGHADVLEALINYGADCDKASALGVTPLMIARRRKRAACIELLRPPHVTWQGRDLIGRSLPEVVLRVTKDFDKTSNLSRRATEELVVREGETVVSAVGPGYEEPGRRRVWRPAAPGVMGWVPNAYLEEKPSTPPEAVAVPPHELPASARVLKLTDRDAIEGLHLERQRKQQKPATPETPPRRQHRTTMITEGGAQRRLEQAAKFASRSEEYGQFEMEHFNNRKVPGAASPLLHSKTGEPPKKATGASRLKSLTVKHAAAMENSKLVHSAVAGVHAMLDEQRRSDRDEAAWRVQDTSERERNAADEMELKAAQWAEEEAAWQRQQEEAAEAKRLEEIAWEEELGRKREQARIDLLNKKRGVLTSQPQTPEQQLDPVTAEFTDYITTVMDLRSYIPPKTPDHVKEQRRQQEKLTRQLEAEAKAKFEAAEEEKRRHKEEKAVAAAAAAAAAEGGADGDGSRPGTQQTSYSMSSGGFSIASGSTLVKDSGLRDRWLEDIMHEQQQQMDEITELIDKLEGDRGIVLSLALSDTPSNPMLNIAARKGTGVAVGMGLNADDDRLAHWRERISHAEEAREEVWQSTEAMDRIYLAKQASIIIDELRTQIKEAIAKGQRRKSQMGPYDRLSLEADAKRAARKKKQTKLLRLKDRRRKKSSSSPAATLGDQLLGDANHAALPQLAAGAGAAGGHPGDFPVWEQEEDDERDGYGDGGGTNDDEGDEEEEGATQQPYSVLIGRNLRTPSPPPTPPPPPTPTALLPRYRVVESQLIRAGRDPSEDSKLIGYTEEGEVITALSTATLLTDDRQVVQRVQFQRKQGTGFGTGDNIGWVSTKQTKWNRMTGQDETTVLLELLPPPQGTSTQSDRATAAEDNNDMYSLFAESGTGASSSSGRYSGSRGSSRGGLSSTYTAAGSIASSSTAVTASSSGAQQVKKKKKKKTKKKKKSSKKKNAEGSESANSAAGEETHEEEGGGEHGDDDDDELDSSSPRSSRSAASSKSSKSSKNSARKQKAAADGGGGGGLQQLALAVAAPPTPVPEDPEQEEQEEADLADKDEQGKEVQGEDEMHKDAKDRCWSMLKPVEMRAVKLLGWVPLTWDEGSPLPMETLYWSTAHQGQERELKPKEIDAAALLGFTEEVWDLGVAKNGQTPSFQFGLLLHRRARNSKLWRYEQDALAIGGGGGGGAKTTT